MIKKISGSFIAILFAFMIGCNTVHGAGEDISAGGKAISNAATKTQEKM